jgi:hypothetical protein
VQRSSVFFAEDRGMRPWAPDVSAQATHREQRPSVHVARRGVGGSCRRPTRAGGSSRVRELLPFAGVGLVRWDRHRCRSLTGAASGNVGVSSRRCHGLTTRGVRADRVGVELSPGCPQGRTGASAAAGASRTVGPWPVKPRLVTSGAAGRGLGFVPQQIGGAARARCGTWSSGEASAPPLDRDPRRRRRGRASASP